MVSLLITLFALVRPTAADEGVGQADCPVGTTFVVNFEESNLEVDLELTTGVFVRALTFDQNNEVMSATIENTTAENITIAVKGGSDQIGNFVTVGPGETETISVTGNPTISNLSVCQGPELEENATLTLDKITVDGDDEFAFTLAGSALADTLSGADPAVLLASETGTFVIAEALTQAQMDAGWSLTSVDCTGNETDEVVTGESVSVTVAAGENVLCMFTNTLAEQSEDVGSLLIAKVDGDGELLPGATFTVDGVAHPDSDADGLVCVDDLTLGDMVSIQETVVPEGFVGDEDIEDVEVTSTETCEVRLAAEDPLTDADVTVVNAEGGVSPEEGVEVSIMKHLCTDVTSVEEFEAIEAEAAAEAPDNAFAPLVATVLACPTIVLTGDIPTEGAISGGAVDFDFSVIDASGTQLLSEDGAFMSGALCESDVNLDADGDGAVEEDVCLDVSHYSFEVIDGVVVITETDAPDGHRFGTIRFTPGSDDADTLVGSIASVEATGVIRLDTTRDADDSVMVHAYNFVTEGTQGGNPAPQRPREGTLGGNPLPDTAMEQASGVILPAPLLAMLMLSALGMAGYAVRAEARRRR